VTTLAGLAEDAGSADGTGSAARFWGPSGVAVDSAGNLYVADSANDTIRKGTPQLTAVTPLVTGAARNADGSVTLSFVGLPNSAARLWAATDLAPPVVWLPIFTNGNTGPDGIWEFTDTNAVALPARFYRCSTP
jgi:DNA-binding beta-propeller fold protein YncE